jgi:hypothetical protein
MWMKPLLLLQLPLEQRHPCCTTLHNGTDLVRVEQALRTRAATLNEEEVAITNERQPPPPRHLAADCTQLAECTALARAILVQWSPIANQRALAIVRRGLSANTLNTLLRAICAHNRTTASVCVAAMYEELVLLQQQQRSSHEDASLQLALVFFREQPEIRLCIEAHHLLRRIMGLFHAHQRVPHHRMCACGGCGFVFV